MISFIEHEQDAWWRLWLMWHPRSVPTYGQPKSEPGGAARTSFVEILGTDPVTRWNGDGGPHLQCVKPKVEWHSVCNQALPGLATIAMQLRRGTGGH